MPELSSINSISADSVSVRQGCEKCTHVLPFDAANVDGSVLKIKPGDVICLQSGVYGPLRFINLNGTADNPITITSCNGKPIIEAPNSDYCMKVLKSRYFRITGGDEEGYGMLLRAGHLGLALDYLTTNFEVDHIEVA